MTDERSRRTGDTVSIDGGYQHRALTSGPAVQRFWHHSKLMAISELLPPDPGDLVLDIGCGSGVVSDHLARAGARVLAVDGSESAIAFASEHYASDRIEFRQGLVDEHFEVSEPVAKAYCLELIEHIHYDQAVALLEHVREVLRPGGQVFVTTPNYRSAWPVIEWFMDRTGVAPTLAGAQHVEFYHPAKLRRLCEQVGLEVRRATTKCGLAPWLAPLSWRMAEAAQRREFRSPWPMGSILVCVARKNGDPEWEDRGRDAR